MVVGNDAVVPSSVVVVTKVVFFAGGSNGSSDVGTNNPISFLKGNIGIPLSMKCLTRLGWLHQSIKL